MRMFRTFWPRMFNSLPETAECNFVIVFCLDYFFCVNHGEYRCLSRNEYEALSFR